MARKRHPNKHIEAAIQYAEDRGWTFVKGLGHCFGILRCPFACFCSKSVWSTPRSPENHAKDITRTVEKCPQTPGREARGEE
ncbi:hypothetical protein SAMN05421753_11524 [Planctomicrobium piriforme]|uniref:Uncharacterized protein n=1 Tax=Planctomicrobium piriforme TaxID=1576369 RepID=A0A1I3N837_9PLAN|nr:hypothetical protein SAMN05421753_11524 [Planctomicrobium piriforme]